MLLNGNNQQLVTLLSVIFWLNCNSIGSYPVSVQWSKQSSADVIFLWTRRFQTVKVNSATAINAWNRQGADSEPFSFPLWFMS